MKIPTILGLAMLITAITLAVMLYSINQQIFNKKKSGFEPKNVFVVNITDSQATITWQTDLSSQGEVILNNGNDLNQSKNDDRDQNAVKSRQSHFITLKNLDSSSKYYFTPISRLKQDSLFPAFVYKLIGEYSTFPGKTQQFTTAPKPKPSLIESATPLLQALRGIIVQNDLNPADDVLVLLTIKDSSPLATFTSTAGNFILPLINLRTADLKDFYHIAGKTNATLTLTRGKLQSKIDLELPIENLILPPLLLGQNLDLKDYLSNYQARQLAKVTRVNQFDLNNDNRVNSLDLSILLQNISKKTKDLKFDFNKDGQVNQKDTDLLRAALE